MYEKNFMQDIAHQNFSKYIPSLHTRRIKVCSLLCTMNERPFPELE